MKPGLVISGNAENDNVLPRDHRKTWHRWGINRFPDEWTADMVFHLHEVRTLKRDYPAIYGRFCRDGRAHRGTTVEVWRPKDWPDYLTTRAFPRKQVERLGRPAYHQSSFDWALCRALDAGYRRIHLNGLSLTPWEGGEPLAARACLEYWIGLAEGRGVTVTIAEPHGLFCGFAWLRHEVPYGSGYTRTHYDADVTDLAHLSKKARRG